MSLVEKRYAESLLDIAIEKGRVISYVQMLNDILDIYSENPALISFLNNPMVENHAKLDVVNELFKDVLSDTLMRFMAVLINNGRISYLPDIVITFRTLANKVEHIVNIEIHSAYQLDMEQLDKISDKYKKHFHASRIRYDVFIEPELIGGLLIKAGDKVYDDTIAGKIKRLNKGLGVKNK